MKHLYLAVEDQLSELVGSRLLHEAFGRERSFTSLQKNGNGYLRSRLSNFCEMGVHNVVLLITDLDRAPCAATLKQDWFSSRERPAGLLFRVAVREVEAWLMADRSAFSLFFGFQESVVPENVEGIADPKEKLLNLAKRAKREVKEELLPRRGVMAGQGTGYNAKLGEFVSNHWCPQRASSNADSLKRARQRLREAHELLFLNKGL
ncbi:MAG: hypothetical protein ACK5W0_16800, partial [Labrys sp. (in: a-proteobacteria)]